MRFPGQWKHLGGLRVSPYTCDFGAMWLQIRATVRITDRSDQVFETITDKAMNNATNVSETNLIWKWTTRMLASVHPRQVLVKLKGTNNHHTSRAALRSLWYAQ